MTAILDPARIVGGGVDLTVDLPVGKVRFQECRREQWLTLKGKPAQKEHRGYWLNGEIGSADGELTAVSKIVDILAKPQLDYWKVQNTAVGAVKAERMGELRDVDESDYLDRIAMLGLGMDAARDEGAARGTAVHVVNHTYVTTGEPPNPAELPESVRPWLRGAMGALLALDPQPIGSELDAEFMVVHPHLYYAGRPDLYAMCKDTFGIRRRTLVDYKTGKGKVYDQAHWQTRGYAESFPFCGYEPPERIVIVGIDGEGGHTIVDCDVTPDEWNALVTVFRSTKRRP